MAAMKKGEAAAAATAANTGSAGPKLLGMGNPLLDISAHVPQSVFDK